MVSLRVKLTLYYLAILSAILFFFGVAIYTYVSRSLLIPIDESLSFQIDKIERNIRLGPDGVEPGLGDENTERVLELKSHALQIIDDSWQIRDELFASPDDHLDVDKDKLSRLAVGEKRYDTEKTKHGELLRVATLRAQIPNGEGSYFIRVGYSLKTFQKATRRTWILLCIAIPLALLLSSYGGLLLANQALRPVDRMTRAAEQIAAGDLSKRVPEPATMDETGRLAATFNDMISRLQAAFERQKQFTSDASHELRTPLAVMRGDIEVTLRRERSNEEYKRALTSNLEEIMRLSRLVEDLLTLARGDTGRIELRCEPVDLNDLCRRMAEYITPLADQRNQALVYEPPPGAEIVPVSVNADVLRIKQLLLNLLDNAIKYTERRGKITLGLKVEEKVATITVTDTGRGIPPEDLPHIFERFFRRSAKTADRSAAGFGLGLSIVKWIVDSHGGRIDAKSELGKGTEFIVRLPLLGSGACPPIGEGATELREDQTVLFR
ncbi:MAG: ATP-binding protein [Acidobacteria bacterium]|nr:ATP-binding protein [Acidobacteriota bacterium]